jgi:putative aldouronate transport system permease protein
MYHALKRQDDIGFKLLSYLIIIFMAVACLIPFLLVISVSFTDENALLDTGYHLIPQVFSLEAYSSLLRDYEVVGRAYGISIVVTGAGTLTSVVLTCLLAYPLSRQEKNHGYAGLYNDFQRRDGFLVHSLHPVPSSQG